MRRTKEEAEQTKRSILSAAKILFTEKGFSETTLDEVAQKAGFTRGAVHWHFQNKFGLLIAIQELERSPMEHLISKLSIDSNLDPIASLHETSVNFFTELSDSPEKKKLFQVMFREMYNEKFDPDAKRVRLFETEIRAMLTKILRLADQRGILAAPWTPESAALAYQTMIKGIITTWLYETADFDLVNDALVATGTFLQTLRKYQ